MIAVRYSPPSLKRMLVLAAVLHLIVFSTPRPAHPQDIEYVRSNARRKLFVIKDYLEEYYYDPTFHGMNLVTRFKAADEKIKQATSNGQIFGAIAQLLDDLNDSHTYFIPPPRSQRVDYGWQMQAFGEMCYVSAVKPGSDAEAKGLKPGDLVLSVDGYKPVRENLSKLEYVYYILKPQRAMQVVVQSPDGKQRQLDVSAQITPAEKPAMLVTTRADEAAWSYLRKSRNENRINRHRIEEIGSEICVWKMAQFDLNERELEVTIDRIRKHKALVLDLRGNSAIEEEILKRLVGFFFDRDLKIADTKGRKKSEPMIVKGRRDRSFEGSLIVLVDSKTGSFAEVLARVIQLEKRGIVVGDKTMGAVMKATAYKIGAQGYISRGQSPGYYNPGAPPSEQVTSDILFGVSISEATLIMPDGKNLEHNGVTPDEILLPKAEDLAAGRDPVLSRAAALMGVRLDAARASSLFPIEWQK